MTDRQLLQAYIKQRDEAAFAELSRRYINLVHSTCMREVRDVPLAEDVTQAVFLLLARKAPSLTGYTTLAGWLFHTSRLASKNAMRAARSREEQERKAAEELMHTHSLPEPVWSDIDGQLHDALARLQSKDRDVLLLRFFEDMSLAQVGERLGLTEDAARVRVNRALERMRLKLTAPGTALTGAGLALLLTSNAVHPASAACAQSVGRTAAMQMGSAAATDLPHTHAHQIAQGVSKAMLITKLQVAAAIGAFVLCGAPVVQSHAVARHGIHAAGPKPIKVNLTGGGEPLSAVSPTTKPVPAHLDGVVLSVDDTKLAGASLQVFDVNRTLHKSVLVATAKSDATGGFHISVPWKANSQGFQLLLLIASTADSVGIAGADVNGPNGGTAGWAGDTSFVKLYPLTTSRIRLVDRDGGPIAHVPVCVDDMRRDNTFVDFSFDYTLGGRWVSQTDSDGWAVFNGMPQGWKAQLFINDPNYVHIASVMGVDFARSAKMPDTTLPVIVGHDVSGIVVYEDTHLPASGVTVGATPSSHMPGGGIYGNLRMPTGSNGEFTINCLCAGTYALTAQATGKAATEWVAEPTIITMPPDKDVSNVTVVLTRAGMITGQVTDKTTHQPQKNAAIFLVNGNSQTQVALTGDDGTYQLTLLPGKYQLFANGTYPPKMATVAYGAACTVNFESTLPEDPPALTVQGDVVGPDGKPVGGADVIAYPRSIWADSTTTDAHGHFRLFGAITLDHDTQLFARFGKLTTLKAVGPDGGGYATLRLGPNALSSMHCNVVDQRGSAIAGEKLGISLNGVHVATIETDSIGLCRATDLFAGGTYTIMPFTAGFESVYPVEFTTRPGQDLLLHDIVLKATAGLRSGR